MRRYIFIVVLAVLVLGVACISFADEQGGMKGPMAAKCEKGGMMKMCPMHCMMMKKQIVATEDGSVVVMVGNKLMKYDKNLELKKEVEIKMDMKEMCDKMCQNCPMCQEMMEKHEMKESPAKEKAEHAMRKGGK